MAIARYLYDGRYGRAARGAGALIRRYMEKLGETLVDWIQQNTPAFTGEAREKTVSKTTGESTRVRLFVRGEAPYSLVAQQTGRKPGKQPPPLVMLDYVRRRGLTFQDRARSAGRGFRKRQGREPRVDAAFNAKVLSARRRKIEARVRKEIRGVNTPELRKEKALAFLIGRAIGRRGTRGLLLFSRVLFVKRGAMENAKRQIEQGIIKLANG